MLPGPTATKPSKGALIFIFCVVLLDIIGLTMLMPISAYVTCVRFRQYRFEVNQGAKS